MAIGDRNYKSPNDVCQRAFCGHYRSQHIGLNPKLVYCRAIVPGAQFSRPCNCPEFMNDDAEISTPVEKSAENSAENSEKKKTAS